MCSTRAQCLTRTPLVALVLCRQQAAETAQRKGSGIWGYISGAQQ